MVCPLFRGNIKIDNLLSKLKKGDILIVSELSRLSRSIREIHNILHILMEKKINLHVIKQNIVTNGEQDMTTKILVTVLSMVAEMERDLISQRTKNGLALVKQKGKKLGNPHIKTHVARIKEESDKWAEHYRALITGFVKQGLTQRQIVEQLNQLNIRTRRDSEWKLVTLQRVMKRLGLETRK